eukprot:1160549-Pelagomonas_calceolata.AAC.3
MFKHFTARLRVFAERPYSLQHVLLCAEMDCGSSGYCHAVDRHVMNAKKNPFEAADAVLTQ